MPCWRAAGAQRAVTCSAPVALRRLMKRVNHAALTDAEQTDWADYQKVNSTAALQPAVHAWPPWQCWKHGSPEKIESPASSRDQG